MQVFNPVRGSEKPKVTIMADAYQNTPDTGMEEDQSETQNGGEDTASLPISAFGDTPPAEGDTFKGTVVSVDQESGTVNVTVQKQAAMPPKKGASMMADEFNQ